jgi:immune inhibitor A
MRGKLFRTFLAAASLLTLAVPMAGAADEARGGAYDDPAFVPREDNRPDPLTTEQLALKEEALQAELHGKAYGKVHEVARGQFVQLAREGEGALWTVLGEFADLAHNTMPEPDRTVDNTTIWIPDFSRDHYMDMLFGEGPGVNSMRNFYIEQSSNRYTVHGDVTDWIPVSGPAASYDDDFNSPLGGNQVWYFLDETIDGWYAAQIAAGKTPAEINAYLSQFDVWDRYDYDGDGNFDEPDGYIDTFQSVHAGVGNEACSPTCDDWAIWSHSWYAFSNRSGPDGAGPAFNPAGGVQIGDSDYWVGKYTIQPENGGVGVFAHEYGHDLGLPDLYDTSGGENGTGFWTLMSSGSWVDTGQDHIGNAPSHMGAWEKFQLGWLNYEVAFAGQKSEHKLGPMETNTKQAQGLFVVLPDKEVIERDGSVGYYANYYVVEYRAYWGYDKNLQVGPYNFGFLDNPLLGNWVEHLPYQDGMLISYWDTSQRNNQVRRHPGQGLLLPVDAHPTAMIRADGGVWRNRMQTYDSTFTLDPTDALTLHWLSQPSYHPSLPAVSMFDDRNSYYDPVNPWGSVIVPNTGTQIRIQSISAQGNLMQVQVRPAK